MTPKQACKLANSMWEKAKAEDEWPDEMRMAYIAGALEGLIQSPSTNVEVKVAGNMTASQLLQSGNSLRVNP